MKLEAWLRLVGLPHEPRSLGGPPRSATGKVPYVDLPDGTQLAGSDVIIAHLSRAGHDPDRDLDAGQRAQALLITRMVEEHLYFVTVWDRWHDDAGWAICGPAYFASLPPLVGSAVAWTQRRKVKGYLHGQGLGRVPRDEVHARGIADLDALATVLGAQPYLLGDRPHTVDCTVFATLSNLLHAPIEGPMKQALLGHANLVDYERRLRERLFPDWDQLT